MKNVNQINYKFKDKNIIKKYKNITETLFKKHNIYQNDVQWKLIDNFYDNMKKINQKFDRMDLMIFYIKLINELLDKDISMVDEIMREGILSFQQACQNNSTIEDILNDIKLLLGVDKNE
jgi:hypothetical protein